MDSDDLSLIDSDTMEDIFISMFVNKYYPESMKRGIYDLIVS